MTPQNKAERRKAFTTFLLLFIVTIALVITIVFFSMQVPFKQNEQFRDEFAKVESERNFTDSFSTNVKETVSLLDSINLHGANSVYLDARIESSLKNMYSMVEKGPDAQKDFYRSTVKSLEDLQKAKKDIREGTDKDSEIQTYKAEKEKLEQKYDDLVEKYNRRNTTN
jgi:hypothetical protein